MDHAAAIRDQIAELEADIRKDPRLTVITILRTALSILDGDGTPTSMRVNVQGSPGSVMPTTATVPSHPRTQGAQRPISKIKQTHDMVGKYLDEHGATHRLVLVQMLTDVGMMTGIRNPLTSFATSMHTLKDHFISDGRGTFRRREGAPGEVSPIWSKKDEGPGLPTSSPEGETEGPNPSESSQY